MSMLDDVLTLAARGWQVFPCDPSTKQPLVQKASAPGARDGGLWLGTDDEAQVRAWWRTRPQAMAGVRCGPGSEFWVLDFDPCEGVGRPKTDPDSGEDVTFEALLAALEAALGESLPPTLTSLTPRGGRHMLWRWVDDEGPEGHGITNSRGAVPSKMIDVRGEGGYIIAPPSVRRGRKAAEEGCDGVAYRWLDPAAPIAEAPAALVDMVLRRGRFARAVRQPATGDAASVRAAAALAAGDAEAQAVRRYGLAALDSAAGDIAAAGKGTRNQTINDRALSIGHLVGAGAISEAVALAALTDAAVALGLPASDKAFGPGGTIARAVRDGMTQPADLSHVRASARERAEKQTRRASAAAALSAAPRDEAPWPGETDYGARGRGNPEPPGRQGGDGQTVAAQDDDEADGEPGPSSLGAEDIDMDVVASCVGLDHSDTDNAERLYRHFGADLVSLAQDDVETSPWLAWTGTHWDLAGGAARAALIAQRLGARIGLEAGLLQFTPAEAEAIEEAEKRGWTPEIDIDEMPKPDRRFAKAAKAAVDALGKRRRARAAHAVTSKNHGRMEKALRCLNPRLRRPPDGFNTDRERFACATHTLAFQRRLDLECPDPSVDRYTVDLVAREAHERGDYITAVVPVAWRGMAAPAGRWRRFLAQMLPDADKRRTVQQFAGLGLLGVPVQYLMFHYGLGANGKSVFLETITRILGPGLAVGLPRETIVGSGERGGGSASPDLVRLYGKRFVRILEVKGDVPLQEDLVKKLTGGEAFPVRGLYQGYFEFQNFATPHMSGNGFPTIDGTDNGIWRRMLVVHWDQTVPPEERRDFEEFVGEFVREEGPGILAWLVEGALDFLRHGLFVAESVRVATADYREEMDPIGMFTGACVQQVPGGRVQARDMYEAYVSWSYANSKKPRTQTKFGRTIAQHFTKSEYNGRLYYMDCELFDVPERPAEYRNPIL